MRRSDRGTKAIGAEFGRRVREHRDRLGVTQMELADAAGLHFTYVSQVERGRRNLTIASAVRLAGALGVDLGRLLAGISPPRDVRACQPRR